MIVQIVFENNKLNLGKLFKASFFYETAKSYFGTLTRVQTCIFHWISVFGGQLR